MRCIDVLMLQWIWLYVSVRDTPLAKEDSGMILPARTNTYPIVQLLVCSLAPACSLPLALCRAVHLETPWKRLKECHSMSFRSLCTAQELSPYSRTSQSLKTTFTKTMEKGLIQSYLNQHKNLKIPISFESRSQSGVISKPSLASEMDQSEWYTKKDKSCTCADQGRVP